MQLRVLVAQDAQQQAPPQQQPEPELEPEAELEPIRNTDLGSLPLTSGSVEVVASQAEKALTSYLRATFEGRPPLGLESAPTISQTDPQIANILGTLNTALQTLVQRLDAVPTMIPRNPAPGQRNVVQTVFES
ncbi:hypothetical protein Pint_21217 [Pistacia integerrima]|uniref:Uncharacterized protein n=1 Tax=Pistacia integerrima TaxID=434235 RepID=A0ACC0XCQ4_9ROSI|nr:hypothetical protein Pint_21217 [Pistacia integerrima]